MRKVLFLDQGEFMGGAEKFLLDFFKKLNGAEKRMLNISVLGAEDSEYQKNLHIIGIERLDFKYPKVKGGKLKKLLSGGTFLVSAFRLRKVIKETGTTVLFSNTPRTHLLCLVAKKLGIIKTPWVAYFHDFTVRPSFLVKTIGSLADLLVANSVPTRKYLRERISKDNRKKLRIVENGVDLGLIKEGRGVREVQKILCLGRIDPRKGQKFVVEAADLLLERNPELEFTIMGSSVESDIKTIKYEKEIKDFVKRRKLKTVKFKPYTENPLEEIEKYDLVLFPSTEPETFGRIVVEALALNKLVLAFNVTGPADILRSYECYLENKGVSIPSMGMTVEKNNAMALAEHIGFMADYSNEYRGISKEGYGFVKKTFNLEETKKQMMRELLEF